MKNLFRVEKLFMPKPGKQSNENSFLIKEKILWGPIFHLRKNVMSILLKKSK